MIELLKKLKRKGISIKSVDGKLGVIAKDKAELTKAVIEEITTNKTEIISFLSKYITNQSIPAAPIQASYELSSSQRRLWVLSQFEGSNAAYKIGGAYTIRGALDIKMFEQAFHQLITRHESLRTIFKDDDDGNVRQWITPEDKQNFKLNYQDVSNHNNQEDKAKSLAKKAIESEFDLEKDALFRVTLIQQSESSYLIVFVMHHIISDGWSMNILLRDLQAYYNSAKNNTAVTLPELRIQYKDFSAWQQRQIKANETRESSSKAYWLDTFSGVLPKLNMPWDYSRPAVQTFNGGLVRHTLSSALTRQLKEITQQTGSTLFMSLLASVNVLLHKYTSQTDITIGSPIAGREHSDLSDQIGFFLNTLAFRTQFKVETSFKALLEAVNKHTLKAFEHQNYPFDELVNNLGLQRDLSRSPLFDVMVVLQNNEQADISHGFEGLEIRPLEDTQNSVSWNYDLTFTFTEVDNKIEVITFFNQDLFKKETINQLSNHLNQVIQSLVSKPNLPISEITFLRQEEEEQLLVAFNDTQADFPKDKTVIDLFEKQVKSTPDNVAIVYKEKELTYTVLNEKANQLGDYLRKTYSVQSDDLIAIQLKRTEWMIIALLGVMKSGAAYVPIDPEYPTDRIEFMLKDSNVKAVIDQSELDKFIQSQEAYTTTNLEVSTTSNHLAYVIYTSGSTGQPKGVMVNHRSVVNLIFSSTYIDSDSTVISMVGTSFDAFVDHLLSPLIRGAAFIFVSKDNLLNPSKFVDLINQHHATHLFTMPNYLKELTDLRTTDLKVITLGGGVLSEELAIEYSKDFILINKYGPTENTVTTLKYRIPNPLEYSVIPIGKPIANNQIYVLDEQHNLLPIGVVGEICIAGTSLARGYLNAPERTAEKFVSNPFVVGERMYKTGDLGRWLSDGNIEFLGRKDDQVKIRGYRIELGEIEHQLKQLVAINDAVVLPLENKEGQTHLAAYYTEVQKPRFHPSISEYFVFDEITYLYLTGKPSNEYYKTVFDKKLKGKTVLEIGTGPDAILSRLALEAGASKIYTVEIQQEVYEKAKNTISSLGLEDKIIVIHGDIMKVNLPEKVDYCISEIVGSIGGSEGAAKLINHARRLLHHPENMIPERTRTNISAVAFSDDMHQFNFDEVGQYYTNKIFDYVGKSFDLRMCVEHFPKECIISNFASFEDIDHTVIDPLEGTHSICLVIEKSGSITGFLLSLELFIDEQIIFNILENETVWLPIYVPVFDEPVLLTKGDTIDIEVKRTLSDNQLNPDFYLSGKVLSRKHTHPISFEYDLPNHGGKYKQNRFYNNLFNTKKATLNDGIKEKLLVSLPDYMVPNFYFKLKEFPLTPNGKLDKKRLPNPLGTKGSLGANGSSSYVAPETDQEKQLVKIWSDVLGISDDKIGIHDDFFSLGGHSLKAVALMNSMKKELGKEVSIQNIFVHPTIAKIANFMATETVEKELQLIQEFHVNETNEKSFMLFPNAGALLGSYDTLAQELSALGNVYIVSFPWHHWNLGKDNFTLDDIRSMLISEVQAKLTKNYIYLLGTSVGTSSALLMAYELLALNYQLKGLFLCAQHFRADVKMKTLEEVYEPVDFVNFQDGVNQLLDATKVDATIKQKFINGLNQDTKLSYNILNQIYNNKKLPLPIHCICGEQDIATKDREFTADSWTHFSDQVSYSIIPNSGHYFVNTHSKNVAVIIKTQINE